MSLRSSGLRAWPWPIKNQDEASAPQRLQALEGQALWVADAGQIEFADEAAAASRSQSVSATMASTAIRWASMGFLVLSGAASHAA